MFDVVVIMVSRKGMLHVCGYAIININKIVNLPEETFQHHLQ